MTLYIGIDWSSNKHDVCFMNEEGGVIENREIAHTQQGMEKLDEVRKKIGAKTEECKIGIETYRNLVLDFLQMRSYKHIYVLPAHQIQGNRTRFAVSRGHNDASDAKLIAEVLRTDRGRLIEWKPDTLLTQQIRAYIKRVDFLTENITQTQNRLRDILVRYYPQATQIFSSLDVKVNLAFIQAYPTPKEAKSLTFEAFSAFCREHHYTWTQNLLACYQRLFTDFPEPKPSTVLLYQDEAPFLAEILLDLKKRKEQALKTLSLLFEDHPDYVVYNSLPGAGQFLRPALLSKMGDNRNRFPSRDVLQAVAGTSPVTNASGKRKVVRFRYACDHDFRRYVQFWARESIKTCCWAKTYFDSVLPRCSSVSHAYRCLGNRWLSILWRLWMDRIEYDEAYHLQQRAKFTRIR